MGLLFITFLAMIVRFEISRLLDEVGQLSSMTPEDALDVYGTMKTVIGNADMRQIVPRDVRDLDARPGVFMYSTANDRGRLYGMKKRGRNRRFRPSLHKVIPQLTELEFKKYKSIILA